MFRTQVLEGYFLIFRWKDDIVATTTCTRNGTGAFNVKLEAFYVVAASTKAKAAAKKVSYQQMVVEAITDLKDRTGCSQPAIEKWIGANYRKCNYKRWLLRGAIKRGVEKGTILVHHNHKNSYKLPAKAKAPAKKKPAKKKAPAKKKKTTKKKATKKKKTTKKKTTRKKKPAKKKTTKKRKTTKKKK